MGIFFDQPRSATRVVTRAADLSENQLAAALEEVIAGDRSPESEGMKRVRELVAQHTTVARAGSSTTEITTETKDNSQPTWWKVGVAMAVLGIVFVAAYELDGTSHDKTRDALLTVFQGGFVGLLALLGIESR